MDDSPVNPVINPQKAKEILDSLGLTPTTDEGGEARENTESGDSQLPSAEVEPTTEVEPSTEARTLSDVGSETDQQAEDRDAQSIRATYKSLYYGSVIAKWELEKPNLIEKITAFKDRLDKGEDATEVRKSVLLMVKMTKLPHNKVVFDNKFNITRQNNGLATDLIMDCLKNGKDTESVLRCVFGHVYGILEGEAEAKKNPPAADTPEPEPAQDDVATAVSATTSLPGDEPGDDVDSSIGSLFGDIPVAPPDDTDVPISLFGSDVRVDTLPTDNTSATEANDEPDTDLGNELPSSDVSLVSWINHLAYDFPNKVDEVEVDGVTVFVPAAYTVSLRRAQSDNAPWLISYDSIFGAQFNRFTGFGQDARQIRFSQLVADQEVAQHADASDLQVVAELIRNSVPRKDGKPLNYALMTTAKSVRRSSPDDVSNDGSRETLLDDLARLVGLDPTNDRRKVHNDVFFLLKELLRGKNADELRRLYTEKVESIRISNESKEEAKREAEEKAKALAKLPPPPVAAVSTPSAEALAKRQRNIDAVRAFIQVQIRDCQTREEAQAIKSEIVEKAKALLK